MRRSFEDLGQKGCFAAGTCVHVSGQAETMPYTQEERQQQARDFLGGFWIHAMEQACSVPLGCQHPAGWMNGLGSSLTYHQL